MNDKPLAGLLAVIIAAPIVVLCCGGALFIIPVVSGFASWLGGFDILSAFLIGLIITGTIMGIRQWRARDGVPMEQQVES
jgi:membrane protein CcdC involved in cytochrome C biogenesis